MSAALEEARAAFERDEVPIGAVLVDSRTGEITAKNGNRTLELSDPSAHAEMLVIREQSAKSGQQRIPEYDMYVTLEPCAMCAAAIGFARIRKLVYGAPDRKGGGIEHGARFFEQPTCHHKKIEISSGIMTEECGVILKEFFAQKR